MVVIKNDAFGSQIINRCAYEKGEQNKRKRLKHVPSFIEELESNEEEEEDIMPPIKRRKGRPKGGMKNRSKMNRLSSVFHLVDHHLQDKFNLLKGFQAEIKK